MGERTTGTLVVGRVKGLPGKFIILLMSLERGEMLESSRALSEDEIRAVLANNYGESEAEIQARIQNANEKPEI